MGLTVELGVDEMGVAEVVADVEDVEEDEVNVVDILCCLLFVCRRVVDGFGGECSRLCECLCEAC